MVEDFVTPTRPHWEQMGKLVSYGGIGTFQIHAARLVDIGGILNTRPTGRHPTPDFPDFQSCHDTRFTGL